MKKKLRKDYINFPICLLRKYWEDGREDLDGLISYIWAYGRCTGQIPDDNISKKQIAAFSALANNWLNSQFGITSQTVKEEVNRLGKEKLCYTGISLDLLGEYAIGEKPKEEVHQLLAMLAIKSCIGKSAYHSISWSYILVRMCGVMRKEELKAVTPSYLDWCNQYASRRKSTALRSKLCKNWGLTYIPNGKGIKAPFYSFSFSKSTLLRELEKKGITAISMKDIKSIPIN